MTGAVEHALLGLRDSPLGSYLGAIGITKVVATQVDPNVTLQWVGSVPHLHTAVVDLPQWLQSSYRPTVVLSPWNGGSGYGAKDKNQRKVLEDLLAVDESRMVAWRHAHAVVAPLAAHADTDDWTKERLVRELRNRAPEEMLSWIDAAVVLTREDLAFPPLLGTGGNDGRLDFSSNFHQRLLDVLPAARRAASLSWASALVNGDAAPLVAGAVGQFDPASAGGRNSSVFGASESLANPWGFVLMVEGASALTPGVVQRLHGGGRAAMPFTVLSSPDGGGSGAAPEQSRGEFWAPRWSAAMTWPEIAQLFREGRAAWDGDTARRAVHMYEAARSFGVARGIDGFTRYGFQQRNGLAFVAVQVDRVQVREDPLVHALLPVEHWIESARGAGQHPSTAQQWLRADRAHLLYAQSGGTQRLLDLLAQSTRLLLAVGGSSRVQEKIRRPNQRVRADALEKVLTEELRGSPEARLAHALVTAPLSPGRTPTTLAQLVLPGTHPDRPHAWTAVKVAGLGYRSLADVLADAAVLCAGWRNTGGRENESEGRTVGRRLTCRSDSRGLAPWQDVHAWTLGFLDERLIEWYLLAFLALDWGGTSGLTARVKAGTAGFDASLALLSPFAQGLTVGSGDAAVTLGIDPTWPSRLRAGKEPGVTREATLRLARAGWRAEQPIGRALRGRGARLASALLIPTRSMTALRMAATAPPEPDDHAAVGNKESTDESEDLG